MSLLQTEALPVTSFLDTTEITNGEPDCETLATADIAWLSKLAPDDVTIDADWLSYANDLIAVGSTKLRRADYSQMLPVTQSRREFFGHMLGWKNPDHKLYAAYSKIQDDRTRLIPLDTFIGTQRILHKYKIDPVNLLKARPEMVSYEAQATERKILALQDLGLDAVRLINTSPALLAYNSETLTEQYKQFLECGISPKLVAQFPSLLALNPEKIKRKIQKLKRASETLGWQGNVDTLIQIFPQILGISDEKLRTHARLLAKHGSTAMTEEEVKSHISEPLEAHIIHLADKPVYGNLSLTGIRRAIPANKRKELTSEILRDRSVTDEILGEKTVQAYLAYAQKNKPTKRRSFVKTETR